MCDGVHACDKEFGFASEKIKKLSSRVRLQEDKTSCSRNPEENNMALREGHHCFHVSPNCTI